MATRPRDVQVAATSAVCEEAELQGTISVGARCVLHPKCAIRALATPIVIGDRNILEDHVVLESVATAATTSTSTSSSSVMAVGNDNIFESGCVVRSSCVGSGNLFEPKAQALAGSVIGNNCLIGSGVVIGRDERVADNSVVVCVQNEYGELKRIVRQQKDYLLKAHEGLVSKYLDTFLDAKSVFALEKNHRLLPVLPAAPATEDTAADADAAPADLSFDVPFQLAAVQGLDMELSQQDLRIKSVAEAQQQTCATGANASYSVEHVPALQATDRLVSADGMDVSLQTLEEIINAPVGSVMLLPLFKRVSGQRQDGAATSSVLSGFARIEIFHPASLTFEPTTPERKRAIQEWKSVVAKLQQDEVARQLAAENDQAAREQEEKDRHAADENAKLEREAREKLELEEAERLSMTPHHRVSEKRGKGLEFRYEVEFARDGPIGINWDLHTTEKTVVSYLEPTLRAFALGIIASRDQLIQLNDVNTTEMGPHEVVAEYVKTSPPRTLVFLCASTKPRAVLANATLANFVQNWTLAFVQPQVLSGWHVRLHLVNWSVMPELDELSRQSKEMALVQASPFLGCQPLADTKSFRLPTASNRTHRMDVMHVTYRGGCTFVEKAEHVRQAKGSAVLVLNNVKGLGRFPPGMPTTGSVPLPVTMISKLDGEIIMAVMEHETPVAKMFVEDPNELPQLDVDPKPLTNEELTLARNVKRAGRSMTFWFVNTSSSSSPSETASVATLEFQVLPALFGGVIPAMPYRIVVAYPQDTACHHQGLGIQAARAVVLVKRGKCSFGAKMRAVQEVGAAGMLLWNTDESLIPLMTEKKEIAGLRIWGATISLSNGTKILEVLERNKNLPSLVNVAMQPQVEG